MKHIMLMLLIATSAQLLAGRYEFVHTGKVMLDGQYSQKQIEKAARRALIQRGWRILDTQKGQIRAKILVRSHTAEVEINYNKQELTIEYVKSTNLGYRVKGGEKMIHRNYNRWIMNLEKDIYVFIEEA